MKTINVMKCVLVKEQTMKYREKVTYFEDAEEIFVKSIKDSPEEMFAMICVDAKGNITGYHEVARGAVCECHVDVRGIFKRALLNNAVAIIVAHNHPSGDPEPSQEDIELTERVVEAGKILQIEVADHIIVGDSSYSFRAYMPEILRGR